MGWQLSQEQQLRLATTTRYMITDQRHAPSKHSITAAEIRDYNSGCMSGSVPLTKQDAVLHMCQQTLLFKTTLG